MSQKRPRYIMHRLPKQPRQPAQPYKRRRLRTAIVVAETAAAAPAGDDTGSGSAADEAWARPAPTERLPRSEAAEGENPGEKLGNDDLEELAAERRRLKQEREERRQARKASKEAAAKGGAAAAESAPGAAPGGAEDGDRAEPQPALPPNTKGPCTLWNPDQRGEPRRELVAAAELGMARPPPPPHPREELERSGRLDKLRQFFTALCRRSGVRKPPFGTFERWHFCWLLHCGGAGRDSLLPPVSDAEAAAEMARVLREDLVSKGVVTHLATELAHRMNEAADKAASGLPDALERQRFDDDAKRETQFGVSVEPNERNLSVLCHGETLKINQQHYAKLKALFERHTPGKDDAAFHRALFSMLLRYKTIRGGGYQAALGGAVFDALLSGFGAAMEGFASPLNSRYDTFCSAFADTDAPFGSLGSFFAFHPERGSYTLNPPFIPEVIVGLAAHCEKLLSQAAEADEALSFVIIVGANEAARNDPAWSALEEGKFSRRHEAEIVGIQEHGYLSGEQHLKAERRLLSTCDSAIFFWQTPAAASQCPVNGALRRSFVVRCQH